MSESKEREIEDTGFGSEEGRTSGLSRVAGVAKNLEKEILDDVKESFDKQKEWDKEREKTSEELEIITGILQSLSGFVEKYGGKAPPFKQENIHVADYDSFTEEEKKRLKSIGGKYNSAYQAAYVIIDYKNENRLSFALKVAHELLHFCAFQSVSVSGVNKLRPRIEGFIVKTRNVDNQREFFFNDINEAITEELLKRFDVESFGSISTLSNDLEDRARVILANKNGKKFEDIGNVTTIKEIEGEHAGKFRTTIESYKYVKARKKLWGVIQKIKEKNPDKFETEEDVFKLFANTYFTGNILQIARLVGKEQFRKLGEKTKAKPMS